MAINWTLIPKDDAAPMHSKVYVTMNRIGTIVLNRYTYRRLDEPAAFHVMLDKLNSRIALKPTGVMSKHAYPARKYGRRGGRVVRVSRLVNEFGIRLPDTMEFPDAEIDADGQLILDLRTARISPKAHSQCRKK